MPSERTGYAPWSLTREAGVQSATVDGTIKVPQNIQPVLDTGFVDERGDWKGVKSSDEVFIIDATHEGVADGGSVLSPQRADHDFIDMTGYKDVFFAIKPTNGGNYAVKAVMGPDTNSFANLTPVDAAAILNGNIGQTAPQDLTVLFDENATGLTADVWNIFVVQKNLANQKNMQFMINNNTGGNSDITFAYLRIV